MRCVSSSTSRASATRSMATARRDAAQSLDAALTTAITSSGWAAAWPFAARASQRSFPVIGLLSSRPPFGRIELAAEIGSRATDWQALEQALAALADFAVAALAFEQD